MAQKKIYKHRGNHLHTQYKLADGTIVPGVTTVLGVYGGGKSALMKWAARLTREGYDPDAVVQESARIGTLAHKFVECHINGEPEPDLTHSSPFDVEQARRAYGAFLQWEASQKDVWYLETEFKVISEEYRYGGTVDILAIVAGQLTVIDLKTSNAVHDSHLMQVAAYVHAFEESRGKRHVRGHILRIGRQDGKFEHHSYSDIDMAWAWESFKNCRDLYDNVKHIK